MSEKKRIKLGALGSGRGSNIMAILDNVEHGRISAELTVVLTDQAKAPLIQLMNNKGIPIHFVDPKKFHDRRAYDLELVRILQEYQVDLIVLGGFMRLITRNFIEAFPLKIMNIHPSLLPAFPGLDVQKKALDHGVKFSGCTVHFVDEGVDTGPIIRQAVVEIKDYDTPETLAARILKEEHRIYSEAIELFAQEKSTVVGRRVYIR